MSYREIEGNKKEIYKVWKDLKRVRTGIDSIRIDRGKDILDLHKSLADLNIGSKQERYYWDVKKGDKKGSYCEVDFDENISICASLYNLPLELIAVCIDNIERNYSTRLLKLSEKDNDLIENDLEIRLLLNMMSEFKDDHLISVAIGNTKGHDHILGTLGVVHGDQNRKILDTIGYDGINKSPPSSIPTNFSLNFKLYDKIKEMISDVSEYQVSELTRLCSFKYNVENDLNNYEIDFSKVIISLYTAIPPAVNQSYEIKFFEFNSRKGLYDSLLILGYPVVVGGYDISPTDGILKKPIGKYFMENGINLIPQFLSFDSTLEMSDKFKERIAKK